MEDGYGIGITNRYEFLLDTDAIDPQVILKQKAKKEKKAAKKMAGKENSENGAKVDQQPDKVNDDKKVKFVVPGKGGKQFQQQPQPQQELPEKARSMKDTQNIQGNGNTENRDRENGSRDNRNNFDRDRNNRNYENRDNRQDRQPRYNRRNDGGTEPSDAGNRQFKENGFRPPFRGNQSNTGFMNNENSNNYPEGESNQQYNNRDDRPARRQGYDRDSGRRYDGQSRNFDGRGGKREFDRKSGSDKTGVKAIEKREGRGAHNWGDHKQDVEDLNIKNISEPELKDDGNSEGNAKSEENLTAPAEEVTYDEYKQKLVPRTKPVYNTRKAGEGEDNKQWKKMVPLEKKKDDKSEDEYEETDMSQFPQRKRGIRYIHDIKVCFNEGKRPGSMNNRRRPRRDGDGRRSDEDRQNAPQVDDRNFPSLG